MVVVEVEVIVAVVAVENNRILAVLEEKQFTTFLHRTEF